MLSWLRRTKETVLPESIIPARKDMVVEECIELKNPSPKALEFVKSLDMKEIKILDTEEEKNKESRRDFVFTSNGIGILSGFGIFIVASTSKMIFSKCTVSSACKNGLLLGAGVGIGIVLLLRQLCSLLEYLKDDRERINRLTEKVSAINEELKSCDSDNDAKLLENIRNYFQLMVNEYEKNIGNFNRRVKDFKDMLPPILFPPKYNATEEQWKEIGRRNEKESRLRWEESQESERRRHRLELERSEQENARRQNEYYANLNRENYRREQDRITRSYWKH